MTQPRYLEGCASPALGSLLSAFDELFACENTDAVLKRAVELARECVGMNRAAIFLRDEPRGVMRGTWGTDLAGHTVDEHFITFDLWQGEREQEERKLRNGIYWTVVDDAPIVVHTPTETCVVGRGWVCCTPIRAGTELLGTMFNDAGLTSTPVDNEKQSRGAILCSLLGTALGERGSHATPESPRRADPAVEEMREAGRGIAPMRGRSAVVMKAARLLSQDPAMTGEELGSRLRLSASRIARVFKAEMGMSLVEYRNRLRLERFATLLDARGENLLEAALASGFGSYAQFHRVFVALRGTTPGRFLRSRASRRK